MFISLNVLDEKFIRPPMRTLNFTNSRASTRVLIVGKVKLNGISTMQRNLNELSFLLHRPHVREEG